MNVRDVRVRVCVERRIPQTKLDFGSDTFQIVAAFSLASQATLTAMRNQCVVIAHRTNVCKM